MKTRRGMLALGAAALAAGTARAQDGPVTLLVPYTPGTGPDLLARLLSPPLQQALGQPVMIENRAGASGNIGTQAVARAAPDGRTLLLQANTFVMNPSLFRQVPYDPVGSFTAIARIGRGDLVLAVNPDIAAGDAAGFAALARRQVLDYASPGIGTPQHLGMALFGLEAKARLNHVPYRGSAPAIQDLIGRRVAAMVLPLHTALPLAEAKQVRLLAVGSPTRAAAAPGVPTMAEAGFPGVAVDLWYGLLGPAGLPGPLVARLNGAAQAWAALPGTQDQLRALGLQPAAGSPGEFAATIGIDLARWAAVIRAAGISAD